MARENRIDYREIEGKHRPVTARVWSCYSPWSERKSTRWNVNRKWALCIKSHVQEVLYAQGPSDSVTSLLSNCEACLTMYNRFCKPLCPRTTFSTSRSRIIEPFLFAFRSRASSAVAFSRPVSMMSKKMCVRRENGEFATRSRGATSRAKRQRRAEESSTWRNGPA